MFLGYEVVLLDNYFIFVFLRKLFGDGDTCGPSKQIFCSLFWRTMVFVKRKKNVDITLMFEFGFL